MPTQFSLTSQNLPLLDLTINFGIGILLSGLIGWHYHRRAKKKILRKDLGYILPVIAMTTLLVITVVKSSLALSLGLVGALSIVRFRTPIKEPEELAYIFLAIALGLCLGADQRGAALLGVGIILVVLSIIDFTSRPSGGQGGNLLLTLDTPMPENEDIIISDITDLLNQSSKDANIRRIDKRPDQISVSCLARFEKIEDVDRLSIAFKEKFPNGSFTLLDDSAFPNE